MELDTAILPKPIEPVEGKALVQTTTTTQESSVGSVSKDSRLFGVSVLAWCLILLILTVCICNFTQIQLYDHVITLSTVILGFYAAKQASK